MRILITGGAGCLGAALVDHFGERPGVSLCVLDTFTTGARGNLPEAAPWLEVHEGSVADRASVDHLFAAFRPTHVIHAAAAYKDPDDWAEDAATNVLGSIHVVQAAELHGVERLVNLQTALCYGRPTATPIPLDAPTAPFTSYGITKTAGEQIMLMSRLPVVSLRLSNICGPRLAIGPIPTFYQRLKAGKGCFCSDSVRDFMDMSDFLSLMDRVMEPGAPTGPFNVSTGEGRSIKDVFDRVAAHLGMTADPPPPIVPVGADDVREVVLDPAETLRAFGWRAQLSFADTLSRQLDWYDAHGVTAIFAHLKPPETVGAPPVHETGR